MKGFFLLSLLIPSRKTKWLSFMARYWQNRSCVLPGTTISSSLQFFFSWQGTIRCWNKATRHFIITLLVFFAGVLPRGLRRYWYTVEDSNSTVRWWLFIVIMSLALDDVPRKSKFVPHPHLERQNWSSLLATKRSSIPCHLHALKSSWRQMIFLYCNKQPIQNLPLFPVILQPIRKTHQSHFLPPPLQLHPYHDLLYRTACRRRPSCQSQPTTSYRHRCLNKCIDCNGNG